MGTQSKGKCKYCGKEYTKGYMCRHLAGCKERKARIASEKGIKKCGYFELVICAKYDSSYWLIIEISANATLKDVDVFLRNIWLECCGHLSAFSIGGIIYDTAPGECSQWSHPGKSMNYKLKDVIKKGMGFTYEYDFGSTTDLVINVYDYRVSYWKKEKMTILSRNNPPELLCDECHKKAAVAVCMECIHDGMGLLCEDCIKANSWDDEYLLPICNSPRMGVCAYEGSDIYPDQFVTDVDYVDKKHNSSAGSTKNP